ncbi:MAG: CdaR family protein [Anaerolineales bacterium]
MGIRVINWLRENLSSLTLSLFLAIIVWVSAVISADPTVVRTYPQPVPLEIIGQDNQLVLLKAPPSSVSITVKTPQSVWNRLQSQPGLIHAWIDLSSLDAGEYRVPVQVRINVTPYNVIKVTPDVVQIKLEPLVTKNVAIDLIMTGEPALGYRKGSLTINPETVTVTGPKSIVDKVQQVQAEMDINGAAESIHKMVDLTPIDINGAVVNGATLVPDTATVDQTIVLLGGYRNVVVKVVTKGEPAEGYWLTNISVSPPTVTVFSADPKLVNDLPGYIETETVDLSGLSDDVDLRVGLKLPNGIELAGEGSVLVRLNIAALEGSLPITLPVDIVGLAPNLHAEISPKQVDLLVSGPLPILKSLKNGNIRVVIDLSGKTAGTYQIKPTIDLIPDLLTVASILPQSVSVTITPINQTSTVIAPTPALTATP